MDSSSRKDSSTLPETARIERIEGDVMPVNTYLVHGPSGIVVIDGQLTLPDADKVWNAIAAAGAPVAALVVTHPHPDHYAGAARILEGCDAPIVATAPVDAVIRRDDATKHAIVGPMMGDAWPVQRRFPDQLVEPGSPVELGGLAFTLVDVGPAESHADSLWILDGDRVFAGDVACNRTHSYLADGRAVEWLAVIDRLESELPSAAELYVGHGPPAGLELLAEQRSYVEAFVAAVTAAADLDPPARHDAVVAAMTDLVVDDRLQFLMELSIEPVHTVLTDRTR